MYKSTKTVTYRGWSCFYPVPAIILNGKFLEQEFGFKLGDQVKVDYQFGKIVITALKP